MAEFEDIFDGEDLGFEEPIEVDNDIQIHEDDFFAPEEGKKEDSSLLDSFLKLKGIQDSKVTIVDENNDEQTVDFYSLSKEEQLEILNEQVESSTPDLDENEITLLNHLRTNSLTVEAFLQQYKDSIIAELGKTDTSSYDIDAYDDQELYLLDLKNKFDLTDEELVTELEKELKNPEVFAKKTTKLRQEYKTLEDQDKANQALEAEQQKETQYNQFANQMVDIATKVNEFHGIELEDTDKNETLSYLLELDDKGLSSFYKDLNNPEKLYEAAWYMRYGKEAFDALKNAYETEISKLKQTVKPKAVVQNSTKVLHSIYDLN